MKCTVGLTGYTSVAVNEDSIIYVKTIEMSGISKLFTKYTFNIWRNILLGHISKLPNLGGLTI